MEKNIFAYKPFFPLNISDFNFFGVCENCNPSHEEVTPLFPSNLPLKVEVLSRAGGGGGRLHTMGYGLSAEFLLHIFNDTYSTSKTFLI